MLIALLCVLLDASTAVYSQTDLVVRLEERRWRRTVSRIAERPVRVDPFRRHEDTWLCRPERSPGHQHALPRLTVVACRRCQRFRPCIVSLKPRLDFRCIKLDSLRYSGTQGIPFTHDLARLIALRQCIKDRKHLLTCPSGRVFIAPVSGRQVISICFHL